MTVTNVATLDSYAQIAAQTYLEVNGATPSVAGTTGTYVEFARQIDGPFGFQGRAFFNEDRNELVIAFTGTEIAESTPAFLADMATNLALAITGGAPQVATAQSFITQAIAGANAQGRFGFDVTYVGHSLGGFLAQAASAGGVEGEVVAFNSPGAGGFLGLPQNGAFSEERYTYIYSDPDAWGFLGNPIH